MAKDIRKEFNGHALIKHCAKGGADVRRGKGDHVVVKYKGSIMVIPDRTLGHGLQSKVVRWMSVLGLAAFVIMLVAIIF